MGASAAMLFSLLVAFVVTPWAAVRLLRPSHGHREEREDRLNALYRRVMRPLIGSRPPRMAFLGLVVLLLLGAAALVPPGVVTVKMLPFDNKSELQVIVRMPEDTPLETAAGAAAVIAGSTVILFDPIFQGLAISLMAGEVASLSLSRMTVPITYYLTHRARPRAAANPVAAA